ncbi:enoyl-CoA hydratase/isomerase family protein [Neobacillus niacini]|uniref:enoyl-CoA hydratase/isomerase family protein n=1 Tax=Neobacillus niacini TaxID=86668 RepID=UPI0021CB8A17|nr:enoyl-CoA hydratase/isomerase family protein [Neobacillus niacini]MCM3768572.1 enoyl-CoA hydratase/isomerase family protein [Neobacillus niacini]
MSFSLEFRDKGYMLFTIKRNEKRNAINYEVMEGLTEAIEKSRQFGVKALVITGEGDRAFCSGGDLSVFHLLHTKEDAYPMLSKMAGILYSLVTLPLPTIALLNGTVIGGGCELAAACDFRLAKKGIKAGFVQGRQAITTGWGGGTILAEKLDPAFALKLLMDSEQHPAEILQQGGFIDAIYTGDPLAECEAFMDKMLMKEAGVLHAYKSIWTRKWHDSNLRERMEEEVRSCALLWESEAHHEHVNKFLKKTGNKQ